MKTAQPHIPRRAIFINPKFQLGVAACFAAAALVTAALFAWYFHKDAKSAFRIASIQAHYHFANPHQIVGGLLERYMVALSAGGLAASLFVFLFLWWRIRIGVGRLVDAFRRSVEGDLSTPTEARGILDVADLGKRIDASRSRTLSLIREAREEAERLQKERLPDEEFGRRWTALKDVLSRIAP